MKTRTIGLLALFVVGILFSTTMVSAYRGDYTVSGPYFSEDRHDAMEQAFADINYDDWYTLMTKDGRTPRVVELVTEENFATFIEAHNAALAGDFQTAETLRAELGLTNGRGPQDGSGFGQHLGNHNGGRQGAQMHASITSRNHFQAE